MQAAKQGHARAGGRHSAPVQQYDDDDHARRCSALIDLWMPVLKERMKKVRAREAKRLTELTGAQMSVPDLIGD